MSKTSKNHVLKPTRKNVPPAIKAVTKEPTVRFTFHSVRTGKTRDLVFVGSVFQRLNLHPVGLVNPKRQKDRLFRAEGVSDEEWSLAMPFLKEIKAEVMNVVMGPLRPSKHNRRLPKSSTSRPRRYSERELAKVGVQVVDFKHACLKCETCGQVWSPMIRRGGKLPRGYWQCPNGCNRGSVEHKHNRKEQ